MIMRFCLLVALATCAMSEEDRYWAQDSAAFQVAVEELGGNVASLRTPAVVAANERMAHLAPSAPGKKEARAPWSAIKSLAQTFRQQPPPDPAHEGPRAGVLLAALADLSQAAATQTTESLAGTAASTRPDEVAWMQRTARLNCALGMIYFRRRWSENLVQLTERGQEGNPAVVAFKELLDQREAAWWDWCLAVPKAGQPQPADVALRPAIDVDDLSRMMWAEGSLSLLPQDHPLVAVVRDSAAAPWIKDLHMWAGPESWPPGYTGIIKPLPPILELTPESIERSINDITHRIVFRLQMRQEQRAALQRELPGSEAWIDTPQLEAAWKTLDAELRLVAACGRLDVAAWDKREASLKSATMRWGVECSHSDRHLSLEQALRLVSEPRRTALRREGLAMLDQLRQATLEVESQPSLAATALPLEPTQSDLEAVDLEATNRERLVDALEQLESELENKP